MSNETSGMPVDLRQDPPPYPWLDDPAQPSGPVPPMLAVGMGGPISVLGAWMAVAGGLNATGGARVATVLVGALLVLIGLQAIKMGLRRRSWRQRHPGLDPLEVARAQNANVGSALGDDSLFARVSRWVLVVVCALVGLVAVLALVRGLTGAQETAPGALVVLIALVALTGGSLGRRCGAPCAAQGTREARGTTRPSHLAGAINAGRARRSG